MRGGLQGEGIQKRSSLLSRTGQRKEGAKPHRTRARALCAPVLEVEERLRVQHDPAHAPRPQHVALLEQVAAQGEGERGERGGPRAHLSLLSQAKVRQRELRGWGELPLARHARALRATALNGAAVVCTRCSTCAVRVGGRNQSGRTRRPGRSITRRRCGGCDGIKARSLRVGTS